jgi:hypothetical protein
MKGNVCFGKEDQKGTVYPTEVNSAIVEGIKHRYDIWGNYIPEGSEERRAKPVRARAGELVHGEKSFFDLIGGEGELNLLPIAGAPG